VDIQIGHLKSDSRVSIWNCSLLGGEDQGPREKIIDIMDLEDQSLDVLYIEKDCRNEAVQKLEDTRNLFPIVDSKLPADPSALKNMMPEELESIVNSTLNSWTMRNNLISIEQIFTLTQHLKTLWSSDRTSFFEELWFFLKSNMGLKNITIIFHDVLRSEEEGQKDKLVFALLKETTDGRRADIKTCSEAETTLMEHYKNSFGASIEILEYHPEKYEIVLASCIEKSPILIMGNVLEMSPLQLSLLRAIFQGLQ
jgi:hypothetical protein